MDSADPDVPAKHSPLAHASSPAPPRPWVRMLLAIGVLAPLALQPLSLVATDPGSARGEPAGAALRKIGEITRTADGVLRAVIKVVGGPRSVAGETETQTLRYFTGYNPADSSQRWPLDDDQAAGPGPTLRAEVGDIVQITMLNQVRERDFGASLDAGQKEQGKDCDQTTKGTDTNWYPGNDKYPNCFHASSSTNIHFHGTHVTPSTTGDNVLITVRPNPKISEATVKRAFDQIFARCTLNQEPKKWRDLPLQWRHLQQQQLQAYDAAAVYNGKRGNLPDNLKLWPKDEAAIKQGLWPQWYSGAYPYCFQIPKCPVDSDCEAGLHMGQAPGTHWYHSHKHGSTALNLLNGLAGAFIIADDRPNGYDGKLKAFYKDRGGLVENVLVVQQIASVVPLTSTQNFDLPLLVNGQLVPTITMQPGEVQLWRMINATVQLPIAIQFENTGGVGSLTYRQTAQDGVQLAWQNFAHQDGKKQLTMAPANRVDLLVQAPSSEANFVLLAAGGSPLLRVAVKGAPHQPPMGFPVQESEYPALPVFLKDIGKPPISREITFGSMQVGEDPARTGTQFTINDRQFADHRIDELMELNTAEEWTIYNADALTQTEHPFHIHVNPFQVVEVYDPNKPEPDRLVVFKDNFIWWDTFAMPAPKRLEEMSEPKDCQSKLIDIGGEKWCLGYFKMRTRFVDFTGEYVQHCHILEHEDRGMMQLLKVVSDRTPLEHH